MSSNSSSGPDPVSSSSSIASGSGSGSGSADVNYPSIISQPGSAGRNYEPILDALRPWIPSANVDSSLTSGVTPGSMRRIFEIGSYPYTHITGFATEFPEVQWHGSARDAGEIQDIHEVLAQREKGSHPNLAPPVMLDIANDAHWAAVHQGQGQGGYDGIIMRKSSSSTPCRKPPSSLADGFMIVNVIHCCPDGLPERVFQHLASAPCPEVAHTQVQLGGGLLKPGGWIGVYGPFLADDGSYRSPADEEFDKTYIRAHDPRLGLRSIPSITALAVRHGFQDIEKKEMPKGNMWVVWQLRA